MKVKDILAVKGSKVFSVHQDNTVFEAMQAFAANKVGSLLVMNDSNDPVGIIGARDVLMNVLKACDGIKKSTVKDIMTTEIIVSKPDDDIETMQKLMTKNRVRHLPIVDEGKIVGIISIGDVVKALAKDLHVENHYLKEYILGKYPG